MSVTLIGYIMATENTKIPDKDPDTGSTHAFRLRLGVTMWVLSWMPFPSALLYIMEQQGWVTEGQQAHRVLVLMWTIQISIGLVGVFIAGSEAVDLIKSYGWRQVPKRAWRIIIGKTNK